MNTFDFYSIQVSSSRKTDLLKAGVDRGIIHSERDGFARYGRQSFPRYRYVASVGFTDVCGDPAGASERADDIAAGWRAKGLSTHVRYFARD